MATMPAFRRMNQEHYHGSGTWRVPAKPGIQSETLPQNECKQKASQDGWGINANSGSWESVRAWRAPGQVCKLQFLAVMAAITPGWRGDHSIASAGLPSHQVHLENYPRAPWSRILHSKGPCCFNYTESISDVARRKWNNVLTQLYREDKLLTTEAMGRKMVTHKCLNSRRIKEK